MTPTELFNDRTFFTLFSDAWKARKDASLGPIRLEVMLEYLKRVEGAPAKPKPVSEAVVKAKAEITDADRAEIDRLNKLNAVDPMKARNEAADTLEAAIKDANENRKWQADGTVTVHMKRNRPVQDLAADMKARGVHVSGITVGLPMQAPGQTSLSSVGTGENAMWQIVVTK